MNEYEVGYKKPPKKNQFKPGQSGNPKGRPKGTKNLETDMVEELNEQVHVTEGTKKLTISKQRALLKTLMAKALKGDVRSILAIIKLISQIEESKKSYNNVYVNDDNEGEPEVDIDKVLDGLGIE